MNTTHTKAILIIGGYGKVGKLIASQLVKTNRYTITLAGRNKEKANNTARQLGRQVTGVHFDIAHFKK
ncbi:saccharopine dehydrogenase NADP-binding domain-containing protein [Rapidithrix thailandica]|uniref:Saccharopine dehydrogenase NADP-binding domain-containing protein n=1 Tax=Rapidithrix thailandica TaxID=413964 RepID=A0AAW9S9G3_9BACT